MTASEHSGAPEPEGSRPNHRFDITEQMRLCLAVESKARALRTRAPLGHELLPAVDRAIETLVGHRQRLAKVMRGLSAHEVGLTEQKMGRPA